MDPSVEESVPGAGTWRVGSASVQRLATGPSRVCGDGERQRREIIHAALLDMGMSQDLSAEAALKIGVGSTGIGVDFCLDPDTRERVRNEAQKVPQKTGLRSQGPASLQGLNAPPPANLLANDAMGPSSSMAIHDDADTTEDEVRAGGKSGNFYHPYSRDHPESAGAGMDALLDDSSECGQESGGQQVLLMRKRSRTISVPWTGDTAREDGRETPVWGMAMSTTRSVPCQCERCAAESPFHYPSR